MANFGGKKKESNFEEKKLMTGWAEAVVVALNPDNEELRELGYNIDESKDDPEYTKDKDGVAQVRMDFFLKEVKTNYLFKKTFFLENRDVVTKPKESFSEDEKEAFIPKYQYVNATGDSFYVDAEENLPDYFTKFQKNKSKEDKTKVVYGDKDYRVAKVGEADLLGFVKMWLSQMDYWDVETSILLNLKKFFNGDYTELKEQVEGEFTEIIQGSKVIPATIGELLGVKIDDEGKKYQDVYKVSVPGYRLKEIRNLGTKLNAELVEKWRSEKKDKNNNPNGRYLKDYEAVLVDVTDRTYPWNREFTLGIMQEFDEEKSFVASSNTVTDTESSDY